MRAAAWTESVIGAAIEVHRLKGPGLLEEIYQKCLCFELGIRNVPVTSERLVPVEYKGHVFDSPLRLDVYVDECLVLELKSVERVAPIHKAQLMSYMKLVDAPLGLLINFHEERLVKGVSRMILPGADIL
jgi:GxxExxY protein